MKKQSVHRMIRKQVYIEPHHEEVLKRRSRELGLTEAALIRLGIDTVASAGAPLPPDPYAWAEIEAFISEYRRDEVPQTRRVWTRDELYDERLERYSR